MLCASFAITSLPSMFQTWPFVSGTLSGSRFYRYGDIHLLARVIVLIGPRYRSDNPQLQGLRTWPVAGFETIRVYYLPDEDTIRVIRVLRGKRVIKRILESERVD